MTETLNTLAVRLVEARTALGVGQDVIAKSARMSQQSYSDLETGKSKGTTKIGSLAHALGVDAYWLETGKGDAAPSRLSDTRATYSVSPESARLVELFLGLTDRRRKALLQLLEP